MIYRAKQKEVAFALPWCVIRLVVEYRNESHQVIWDKCELYTSWTERCWLPDSVGGGHSERIWWYLTPAWIGWQPQPRPALALNPLLRFSLAAHISHEQSGPGKREQTNIYVFFVCLWFDTKTDGLWLTNAQKSSPFRTIHKKWHFNSTPFQICAAVCNCHLHCLVMLEDTGCVFHLIQVYANSLVMYIWT